jgi:hypothetical protein
METRLAHELGWSEHFIQKARSIAAIKIRLASVLATLRLVRSVCDFICSIFDFL